MSNFLNAQEIRDRIPISQLLEKLGFMPVKKFGQELIYISMLRDKDPNPSFSVNDSKALWYDRGGTNSSGIRGGNVIDFGIAYWKDLSFDKVLQQLTVVYDSEISDVHPKSIGKPQRPRLAIKLPHYKIEDIKPLGCNPIITAYLQYRGIWNVPHDDMKEIYYYIEDEKKVKKRYCAAGWQNEYGIWEVKNKYFRGALGLDAISFIQGKSQSLMAFEDYFDYKSWQLRNPGATDSILVLNSNHLIVPAIQKAKAFSTISTFFRNDTKGREVMSQWSSALSHAADHAFLYESYSGYNAMTMAEDLALRIKSQSVVGAVLVKEG